MRGYARRSCPLVVWIVLGCGARSELHDERGADAGVPFATLPCRWSLGSETVVGETDRVPGSLVAGVSGGRAEVLIATDEGAVVATVADPPVRVREVDLPPVQRVLTAPDGWVAVHGAGAPACVLHLLDAEAASVRSELIVYGGSQCSLTSRRPDAIDVALTSAEDGVQLLGVRVGETLVAEDPVAVGVGALDVVASRDGALGWVVAMTEPGGTLAARRVGIDGTVQGPVGPVGTLGALVFASPDRLRPGLALLRLDDRGRSFVDRVPLEGTLRIERVAELPERSAIGRAPDAITTNETEALVPLADGRVVAAALNGIAPATFGPVTTAPEVHHVVVALRTGTSVGGVAYTYRQSATEPVRVAFRPLSCNR